MRAFINSAHKNKLNPIGG